MTVSLSYFDVFEADEPLSKKSRKVLPRAAKLLNFLLSFKSVAEAQESEYYGDRVLVSTVLQEPRLARGDWRPLVGWLNLVDGRADSWGSLAVDKYTILRGPEALHASIGLPLEIGNQIENAEEPFDQDPRRAICTVLAEFLDFHGVRRPTDADILRATA